MKINKRTIESTLYIFKESGRMMESPAPVSVFEKTIPDFAEENGLILKINKRTIESTLYIFKEPGT